VFISETKRRWARVRTEGQGWEGSSRCVWLVVEILCIDDVRGNSWAQLSEGEDPRMRIAEVVGTICVYRGVGFRFTAAYIPLLDCELDALVKKGKKMNFK